MRKARVLVDGKPAGLLLEKDLGGACEFIYDDTYHGDPVSLTMPVVRKHFSFSGFPPFFEGLLPEGLRLEALLRKRKMDANDLFAQLLAVGADLVGAVSVCEVMDE